MSTWTGAWSRLPVADGSVGLTSTSMVGVLPDPELPDEPDDDPGDDPDPPAEPADGLVATVPTYVTTPGVVLLPGRMIVTRSPTITSPRSVASSWTVTWRDVELASKTGVPAWAGLPSVAGTLVTLAAEGKNTAWPRARLPV